MSEVAHQYLEPASSAVEASQKIMSGGFLHVVGENVLLDEALYPSPREPIARAAGTAAVSSLRLVETEDKSEPITLEPDDPDIRPYSPLDSANHQKYPHRYFAINPDWMRGGGVVNPTLDSRTRAAVTALKRAFPELPEITVADAHRDMNRLQGNIKQPLTIGAQMVTKQSLRPLADVLQDLAGELTGQNHPIMQLIYQMREEFADIPKGMLQDVEALLLVGGFRDDIMARYRQAVAMARKGTVVKV